MNQTKLAEEIIIFMISTQKHLLQYERESVEGVWFLVSTSTYLLFNDIRSSCSAVTSFVGYRAVRPFPPFRSLSMSFFLPLFMLAAVSGNAYIASLRVTLGTGQFWFVAFLTVTILMLPVVAFR